MLRVYACVTSEHDARLLLLALSICLLASLTAFSLAGHVRDMPPARRPRWLLLLGFVTGAGIWATHFIAMLAYRPHLPTAYAPDLTLLSIIIAVAMASLGWHVALSPRRWTEWSGGLIITTGIGLMHFTGMAALKTNAHLLYDRTLIAAFVIIAWLAVTTALHVGRSRPRRIPFLSAFILTFAIAALHFGSMAAVTLLPDPNLPIPAAALDEAKLTMTIAFMVLVLLGVALATALLDARLTRSAKEEAERLKAFSESAREGLAILEGDRVVDANRIFWTMAGHDPDLPPADFRLSSALAPHPGDAENRSGSDFVETELRRAEGKSLAIEYAVRTSLIFGQPRQLLVMRDISARKATAARISHLASHDSLTGAANAHGLNEALDRALGQADREGGSAAMLCLDLDRFKAINDLHGHPAGDAVLIEVTKRIGECLQEGEVLARLGGDEFAIVQPGCDQPNRARALARMILSKLREPVVADDCTIIAGTSIGIALYPTDAATGPELRKKADLALYRAKSTGRGLFCCFEPNMDSELRVRRRVEADLPSALAAGQLDILYQPLACLETGGILGFEAFLRWRHPELGDVPPALFTPMAEDSGAAVAIGNWVLRETCREAQTWAQPLKIAVNLSALQFAGSALATTVRAVLAETGLDPSRLELEITESLLIQDTENTLVVLRELQAMGVRIVMDDFGTGYSSLSYFRLFPFDKVKIDHSFVDDMAENRQSLAIVKAVIGLGKALGMLVIAEGVESRAQLEQLAAEGCHQVQGFLIGRPAPIDTFQQMIADRNASHPCRNDCDQCLERLRPRSGVMLATDIPIYGQSQNAA